MILSDDPNAKIAKVLLSNVELHYRLHLGRKVNEMQQLDLYSGRIILF